MSIQPSDQTTSPLLRGARPLTLIHGQQDPLSGAPIFISGCNRGGTTILSELLAEHPHLCNVGRGHVNEGQYIWRRRWPDWSRHRWALPPWRWYLRRDGSSATPETLDFFHDAFEEARSRPGRMMEKTPANAMRIPFIDRLYPDCFFVHVLRDGRHTSASLMARGVWPVFAPHQWVGAHRTALADLQLLPERRVVLVRYEELVKDPDRTLGEVCRKCGLSWERQAREQVLEAARGRLRDVERRWARLRPATQRYALRVIEELQAELGYSTEI